MLEQTHHYPVFGLTEDLILQILRPHFERVKAAGGPEVHVYTAYQTDMEAPFVLALNTRRTGIEAYSTPDDRWIRATILELNTVATGLEAERDAADLQESVRHALIEAHRNQVTIPGVGSITKITSPLIATRQTDWASASGPVQYAKLPQDAARYEARYRLLIRPDEAHHNNKFLPPFEGTTSTEGDA